MSRRIDDEKDAELLALLRTDARLPATTLAGDLSRDVIHRESPALGIDCVSQIAIDQDWSAMRMKRI